MKINFCAGKDALRMAELRSAPDDPCAGCSL